MQKTYLLKIINEDRQVLIEKMFHNLDELKKDYKKYVKERIIIKILSDKELTKRLKLGEKIY
jgi:hypothetical protein